MILSVVQLLIAFILAFFSGKLMTKIKMPAILGWLIAGMILGPHAISLLKTSLLDAYWYQVFMHILECTVGLMIGTELVWKKIKKSGKAILITTFTQSVTTFLVVSLTFAIVFYFTDVPLYLSVLFGGIALATAPAPALSIVQEFRTDGPVTKTLIPMAALDDIIGCIIFFSIIAVLLGKTASTGLSPMMIALVVILPLFIGIVCGGICSALLKRKQNNQMTVLVMILSILFTSAVGFLFNYMIMPRPVLNFMLIGMAFSATFANIVSEKKLTQIMTVFHPFLGIAMIFVILNLGAPLNYKLIMGAGIYTVIYIVARASGKYFGAYFGASITDSPATVKKYLGLTLLPHSGVSLVFTGIAASALKNTAPDCAQILQGTIAAAAVINEVIAVYMAKKGFEWANELNGTNVF